MNLMRLVGLFAAVLGIGLCAGVARATPPAPAKIELEQETLANGLHVIYAPLHQAPVVHVHVVYHVGSRDERPDRQGFAHMFEHMMFRGSAHVKPEEHMKRIGVVGGNCNAFTGFDTTQYVDTLPSQYLPMALWLEADRMSSFKVSDQIYKTERNVVAEEWRMRMNRPYGDLFEQLMKRVFVKHSYRWTPIGDMDDLRQAPSSELQKFFNKYYVPNNATLIIAGDFDPQQAKEEVHKYFAWIPEGAKIEREIPAEPKQTKAREATINEAVPLDAVVMAYKLPPYRSADRYAMDLLSTILGTGDSSRVRQLLVNGKTPMAVDAYALDEQLEDGGVFGVGAIVMHGKDPRKVHEMLVGMIDDVVKNGVSAEELEKAKNQARIALIEGRKTADDLASQIADEAVLGGDANAVNDEMQKVDAVTLEDIKRVAQKYLSPQEATSLEVQPSMLAAADKAAANQTAEALKTAPVAAATEPVAPRKVEFPAGYPTTPPTASARTNPKFEKGTESEIDGVKVIVMPDRRLPLVSWSLTMRRGSQSDPAGKEGTAWLTDEMVRRGVTGMDFDELTQDLDSRGITITVGDGGDYTRLHGSCTTDQLDHAIERSGQILHQPTFPADQFAKLKAQSIDSLRLSQESPGTVAGNELTHAIYGDSVLGRYSTPESVARITLDDVQRVLQDVLPAKRCGFRDQRRRKRGARTGIGTQAVGWVEGRRFAGGAI